MGWSPPLFYKKIGRQAESLSAHKWREKTGRSVVDAGRRTVGSTQVSRLGVVVAPGSKGVIPLALKKFNFEIEMFQIVFDVSAVHITRVFVCSILICILHKLT